MLICVYVVILSGCLDIVLICIRNCSLFDFCTNILNDIVLELCCSRHVLSFLLFRLFLVLSLYVTVLLYDVRLSHLNKDYLLIYLRLSCTETSWPYNRLKYRIHRYPSQVLSSSAVNSIIRRAFQVLFVCCLVVVSLLHFA